MSSFDRGVVPSNFSKKRKSLTKQEIKKSIGSSWVDKFDAYDLLGRHNHSPGTSGRELNIGGGRLGVGKTISEEDGQG